MGNGKKAPWSEVGMDFEEHQAPFEQIRCEHLKTGVSLSTHVGCDLGCIYCVAHPLGAKPLAVADPADLQAELERSSTFRDGYTPILINNRTEPFHPVVAGKTIRLLNMLQSAGMRSPIVLITRLTPPASLGALIGKLPLVVFFTHSGLGPPLESASVARSGDRLAGAGSIVPKNRLVHYFRPIVPLLNGSDRKVAKILGQSADLCASVVMAGLRHTPRVGSRLRGGGIVLDASRDVRHKGPVSSQIRRARQLRDEAKASAYILRHTSCAISVALARQVGPTYLDRGNDCDPKCPMRVTCMERAEHELDAPERTALESWLATNGVDRWNLTARELSIAAPVAQEHVAFLRMAFGVSVRAPMGNLAPSERFFLEG